MAQLNTCDAINIVETLEVHATFSRHNLTEFGMDIVHCNRIGGKVQVRFKSIIANNSPRIKERTEAMKVAEDIIDDNAEVGGMLDMNVEPGTSIFYYENCELIAQLITSRRIFC